MRKWCNANMEAMAAIETTALVIAGATQGGSRRRQQGDENVKAMGVAAPNLRPLGFQVEEATSTCITTPRRRASAKRERSHGVRDVVGDPRPAAAAAAPPCGDQPRERHARSNGFGAGRKPGRTMMPQTTEPPFGNLARRCAGKVRMAAYPMSRGRHPVDKKGFTGRSEAEARARDLLGANIGITGRRVWLLVNATRRTRSRVQHLYEARTLGCACLYRRSMCM